MPQRRPKAWRRNVPRTSVTSALIARNYAARAARVSMGYELVSKSEKLADEHEVDLDSEMSGLCKLPAGRRQEVTDTVLEQNPVATLHKSTWDLLLGFQCCDSLSAESLVEIPVPPFPSTVSCFDDSIYTVTTSDVGTHFSFAAPVWKDDIATESPASARLHNAVSPSTSLKPKFMPTLALCATDSLDGVDMVTLGGPCIAQQVVKDGTFSERRVLRKDGQRSMPSETPCQKETGNIAIAGHLYGQLTDDQALVADPTLQCATNGSLQPRCSGRQSHVPCVDVVELQTREVPNNRLVCEAIAHDAWQEQAVAVGQGHTDWHAVAQEDCARKPRRSTDNALRPEAKSSCL